MVYTEQDKEKYQQIISQVEENGVSQNDVVSFESMIGSNFITNDKMLMKFSWDRSSINSDYVISKAKKEIANIESNLTKYTVLDVCKKAQDVNGLLHNKRNDLVRLCNSLNDVKNEEKVIRTLNEKYSYKYIDDEVVDLSKDFNILDAFRFNRPYLQGIANESSDYDYILNIMEEYVKDIPYNSADFSPLFTAIFNKNYPYIYSQSSRTSYDEFSLNIQNIIRFIKDFNSYYSEELDYLLNHVKEISDDYDNKSRVFGLYDYKSITTTYNNLENLETLFKDKLFNVIIRVMERLYL